MLIVDAIVLTTVVIVFQDVRTAMYTLFFILIDTLVIDLIGEGGFAGKGFLIVTSKPEEIAKKGIRRSGSRDYLYPRDGLLQP